LVRRSLVVLALVTAIAGAASILLSAHAGLRSSNPRDGVRLGETPTQIQLSFFERPETVLSSIQVLDSAGAAYQAGAPMAVPDDPLSLVIPVRPLAQGVYIVHWRIVSAIDGHVTSGSYAFGVRVSPGSASAAAANTYPATSRFEIAARSVLLFGLIAVLGAAGAGLGGFGGTRATSLAAGGWCVAAAGLVLLASAQMRNTGVSLTDLPRTAIGRAVLWRAAALGVAAASLAVASVARKRKRPRAQFIATAMAAVAALGAIAAHVIAGHAAAVPRLPTLAIAIQWLHFTAAAVWIGGLAALLLAVRGEPAPAKTAAVRRFSLVAAIALVIVAITGAARAVQEIPAWTPIVSTVYGRAVLAKALLLVVIASFGAVNRWYSVPAAAATLRPLRRAASVELLLMAAVVIAAGTLGALPPPSSGGLVEAGTLDVSGADFATSARATLTAMSDQPGPNRFTVRVLDFDTKAPIRDARVTLRFTPVDDPGIAPTSLRLEPRPGDLYEGSGANLSFEGRWRVVVLIERAGTSTEVPLDVEVRGAPLAVSVDRRPGRPVRYSVAIRGEGAIWISPDPERAGPATLRITSIDLLSEHRPIDAIVVTAAAGDGPVRQLSVHRIDSSNFTADVDLQAGRNTIIVIARAVDGARLRAAAEIDVPSR
jgi:copper transport protein